MSFISGSESTINSARARSIFSYAESEGDDELNDVHYMDDIEQDQLVSKLIREDITKNEFYSKALATLCLVPVPFYLVHLYHHGVNWPDMWSLVSLIMTFMSVPKPHTNEFGLAFPGFWTFRLQRINLIVTTVLTLGTAAWNAWVYGSLWPRGYLLLEVRDHIAIMPWMLIIIVGASRKFMEAINLDELEKMRYNYKGA